jgi:3-deoxy-D-manno-octulosonate 8-phosphate phosphatase (KDO 8-P phosphatase)
MSPTVKEKAAMVSLLIVDVDGVMTDSRIILDGDMGEYKAFHVRDGHGIKMLQREGVKVAIITGRSSAVVNRRAAELGIEIVVQGSKDKVKDYVKIIAELGLRDEEVAYVGDDIVDIPVMLRVGLPVAVADAEEYVKQEALLVTERGGGRGAVREVTDMILRAKGLWDEATKRYYKA